MKPEHLRNPQSGNGRSDYDKPRSVSADDSRVRDCLKKLRKSSGAGIRFARAIFFLPTSTPSRRHAWIAVQITPVYAQI
jgi:hypothetical protein